MAEPTSSCVDLDRYCARVDTLFNLPGVHVLDVAWQEQRGRRPAGLRLTVKTGAVETGCPGCGVIAQGRGRRPRLLHDIPALGAPVELVWRQDQNSYTAPTGLTPCVRGTCSEPLASTHPDTQGNADSPTTSGDS